VVRLRQALRFVRVLLHVLAGVIRIRRGLRRDHRSGASAFNGEARREQIRWCERMCELVGIQVRQEGTLAEGAVLIACNHISWLEIPVLARLWPLAFLSKSEVAGWPLIGEVATGLGTLYIGRGNGAGDAISVMGERLRTGGKVLFFPEGTTSRGEHLLPLRPRLFQAAVDVGAPVQPMVVRYFDADGHPCRLAPFVDDQSLLTHVWNLCAAGPIEARVWVGEPIASTGLGRTDLAGRCREALLAGFEAAQTS